MNQTGPYNHTSSPNSLYYTCQDITSCKAYLLLKSKPPYNSVPSLSSLTSSNPEELARINNVANLAIFPENQKVIVPLTCSCTGTRYQSNTSFVIGPKQTYFIISTHIFQGVATCASLQQENPYNEFKLFPGLQLRVPLKCACPSRNQTENGIKSLLTYVVKKGDSIVSISERYNVSMKNILHANKFQEEDPIIFPSTTLLIPLQNKLFFDSETGIDSHGPSRNDNSKRKFYLAFSIAGGSSLVLCVILTIAFPFYKNRSKELLYGTDLNVKTKWIPPEDLRGEIASYDKVLKVFNFDKIRKATKKFSPKNRINNSVYRGDFGNKILAVKKMSTNASKEVNMLKRFNHTSLINLEGVCENHERFYLLLEYMPNGSLRDWLSRRRSKERWSWSKRIQIALDIAHGLHYLHNFTEPPYTHNNINSSNVLLNTNLRAKISNFSLARISVREEQIGILTENVFGTRGYLAPEYREVGLVSPKIDVYAFGVVVLELITGKEAVFNEGGKEVLLAAVMESVMTGDWEKEVKAEVDQFVDSSITEDNKTGFAFLMGNVSMACLIREPERRPSMGEVVSYLLKVQADLVKQPESVDNECNITF